MSRSPTLSTTAALSPTASSSIQKGQQTTSSGLTASQTVLPSAPSKSSVPLITPATKSIDQASCVNYSTFMGAHNMGQSLKIQKFRDAIARQVQEVQKRQSIADQRLANLTSAVNRGAGTQVVNAFRKASTKARTALFDAKKKLVLYTEALSSCVSTGYSDPSKVPGAVSESTYTRTQSVPRQEDEQQMFATSTSDDPIVEEALVLIAAEEKPWYTNPLVIGLGVLAAGGAYVFVRRQQ